ncbi:MAG: glycosyltransferase [Bacteroidetes bacterium]|nr:MAG: glycosyltransferase [Bacteroidota bacterium]
MRIVIINDMLWGGGRERRIVQLIAGLNEAGYNDIHLVLLDDRIDYPQIHDLNVTITKIIRSSNKDWSVFKKLRALFKEIKPDVVNTWSFMSTFYAAPICKLMGIKCIGAFIVDCNNPKFFSLNGFAKIIGFWLCNKIISNSYAGHESYRTPKRKRLVIYNGFDNKRLENVADKDQLFRDLNIDSTKHVVSMVARFDRQKDFQTFIKACQALHTKRQDFVALCVGQGESLEETRNSLTDDEHAFIRFTGFRKDVEGLIQISDIGALCTNPLYHGEGVSNSILEFMAFSKPVIATSGGGTNEIVEDNKNGFLITPYHSDVLAEKMDLLLSNENLYQNMSEEAKHTVKTKFSLQQMTNRFIEVYKTNN